MLKQMVPLKTEHETRILARTLSLLFEPGDILFLKGGLGSGKTTFSRYFIQSLSPKGDQEEVPSPTFTLAQSYMHLTIPVWHFDLYRLESVDEIWELGIEEAFASAVCLIEWPEKLESLHMKPTLTLHFEGQNNPNMHSVKISGEDSFFIQALTKTICP